MFDRLPLKKALLLGACIIIPISQATGDGVNNYPAMGVVIPGGAQMTNVSAPAAVQPARPAEAILPVLRLLQDPSADRDSVIRAPACRP